jgi:hypothetical protein
LIPGDAVPDADLAEVIAANLAIYRSHSNRARWADRTTSGPSSTRWAPSTASPGYARRRRVDHPRHPLHPTNLTVIMPAERIRQRGYAARSRP